MLLSVCCTSCTSVHIVCILRYLCVCVHLNVSVYVHLKIYIFLCTVYVGVRPYYDPVPPSLLVCCMHFTTRWLRGRTAYQKCKYCRPRWVILVLDISYYYWHMQIFWIEGFHLIVSNAIVHVCLRVGILCGGKMNKAYLGVG